MLRIELLNPQFNGTCAIPAPIFPSGLLDSGQHSDIDNATISFNRNETDQTKIIAPSFAQDIEFYNDAFSYIKWLLIDCNPNQTNSLQVNIYDDCCEITVFEGVINKNDLEFCQIVDGVNNECSITVKLQNSAQIKTKYDCIRTALIDKRDTIFDTVTGLNFENLPHYFYRYCKELRPRVMSDIFAGLYLSISAVLGIIFLPLFLVIGLISSICSLLSIDFDNDTPGQQSLFEEFSNALSNGSFARYFLGCGKGHVVPRVRHFIENACIQCGISFESSIFNDTNSAYYDTGYLFARAELEGTEYLNNGNIIQDISDEYFRLNAPNMTAAEFLNKLVPHFNAFWDVVPNGGTNFKLIVEQIAPPSTILIDLESETDLTINQLCYKQSAERSPAILSLKHASDPADQIADENEIRFDDNINWKSVIHSYNNADLVGRNEFQSNFARSRHRNDGITRDVVSWWFDFDSTLNNAFYLPFIGTAILVFKAIAQINPFADSAFDSKHYLLLNTGVTFTPKLLIPNIGDDRHYQTCVKIDSGLQKNGVDYYYYNNPVWFADKEDLNGRGKPYFEPNLFSSFWFINNPNVAGAKQGIEFELTLEYDCETITHIYDILNAQGLNVKLRLPYLSTYVETYELNSIQINNQAITISGVI